MGHCPAEKLASRCWTNVRKQHLSENDVTIIQPIDSDSWLEDVNVTGTETGHCYGDHHRKFDLVFSGRVALMSLFLVAVGT